MLFTKRVCLYSPFLFSRQRKEFPCVYITSSPSHDFLFKVKVIVFYLLVNNLIRMSGTHNGLEDKFDKNILTTSSTPFNASLLMKGTCRCISLGGGGGRIRQDLELGM